MLDHMILASVAEQMIGGREIVVDGRSVARFADWVAAAADGAVSDGRDGVSGD